MTKRLRVGVLYGGRSGEHEVSLRSAQAIIAALDPARYDVVPIAITKQGRWYSGRDSLVRLARAQQRLRPITSHGAEVAILPEPTRRGLLVTGARGFTTQRLDVVFPVLHGTFGEDGTVQGLLELAGLPYVGAGVLGSAVGMDKDVAKRLLREAGLPVVDFVTLRSGEIADRGAVLERLAAARIGYPCFVKPANLGSSVGISKVDSAAGLAAALRDAARYDTKILIEAAAIGRELEIGVIGNPEDGSEPLVSAPGEVIPGRDFYDYIDKYVGTSSRTIVPAELSATARTSIEALARRAYVTLECTGMARVDFFLDRADGRLLVNEINTIPGFTSASLFPRMWEAAGVSFAALVDRLIALALARHACRAALSTSFEVVTPPERTARPGGRRREQVRSGRRVRARGRSGR